MQRASPLVARAAASSGSDDSHGSAWAQRMNTSRHGARYVSGSLAFMTVATLSREPCGERTNGPSRRVYSAVCVTREAQENTCLRSVRIGLRQVTPSRSHAPPIAHPPLDSVGGVDGNLELSQQVGN